MRDVAFEPREKLSSLLREFQGRIIESKDTIPEGLQTVGLYLANGGRAVVGIPVRKADQFIKEVSETDGFGISHKQPVHLYTRHKENEVERFLAKELFPD